MHSFSMKCDPRGMWTLTGPVGKEPLHFCDLPEAVEFARKEAGGEEADIELWADGLYYMFVHQEKGWPHCLYARAPGQRGAMSSLMTSMNPSAGAVTTRQHRRAKPEKAAPRTTVHRYLRSGFEGLILVGLFLVLAGTTLYLRARLGFVL